MKLNLLPLLLLLLSGCQAVNIFDPKIEQQRDLYIQKNECGKTRSLEHNVLSLIFSIKEEDIKGKDIDFVVTEELSRNHQKIFMKKDHLLYPLVFGGKDHKEYNMPDCEKGMCLVELYVFTLPWKNLGKNFEVSLKASSDGRTLFEYHWDKIPNEFQELEKLPIPNIVIKYDESSQLGSLKLRQEGIKQIMDTGAKELEAVIVWREAGDVGYREHFEVFKTSPEVKEIHLQRKIIRPVYFAGMVLYKSKYSFETKLETMDQNSEFFKCNK